MSPLRLVALFVCLGCGHSSSTEAAPVTTPAPSATASAAPSVTASSAPTATAIATNEGTMFCESESPPMPVDPNDARAGCWYAGTSCSGHGGQEGEHFKVAGTLVSGEFVHGGCNPGSYALVYEPSTSPLRVRVCAKRSPPQKCRETIRDGAKWDVAPLLRANNATAVTIVQ